MRTYEADIRIAVEGIQQGTAQRVTIQADRSDIARAMLEVRIPVKMNARSGNK